MTENLPQPDSTLTGDNLAQWIDQRDRLTARGPVTVTCPDEKIGTFMVMNLAGETRRVDAVGTVEFGTYEYAMAQLEKVDPTWLASVPPQSLVGINGPGFTDEGVTTLAQQNIMMLDLSDSTVTVEGLASVAELDNLQQFVLGSDTLGDEAVDTLAGIDVMMLGFRLPKASGAAVSRLLSTAKAKMLMPQGITGEQLRGISSIDRSEKLGLTMSAADDVTTGDVIAAVNTLGSGLSEFNIHGGPDEGFLDESAYLRLQHKFPDLTINNRWTGAKAVQKLAARAGVDLETAS